MAEYELQDNKTGRKITIDWHGEQPPTEQEIDNVFAKEFPVSYGVSGSWDESFVGKIKNQYRNIGNEIVYAGEQFAKIPSTFWGEITEGTKDIGGAIQEELRVGRDTEFREQQTVGTRTNRAWQVVSGGMQTAYAPVTAITKSIVGEPIERELTKSGYSPTVSKIGGVVGEIAPQIIGGMAIPKVVGRVKDFLGIEKAVQDKIPIAIQNIRTALQEGRKYVNEQKLIYEAERATRFGAAEAVASRTTGKIGFAQELKQLEGTFTKAEFKSIRDKVSQDDIVTLFEAIKKSPALTYPETISARNGLRKILGDITDENLQKGEIFKLEKVFGRNTTRSLIEDRTIMQKIISTSGDVLNIPRALMASTDLSAPFRQGIFLIGRPQQFIPAFIDMFKYAVNEKAYIGLLSDIAKRPTYKYMKGRLSLTNMGEVLGQREERFLTTFLDWMPNVRIANRAYSGFLNKLRADVFDDLIKNADKLGILSKRPNVVNDIARFVNAATGRGDLGALEKSAVLLNAVFFSPKLMTSRLNLLNPRFYYKLDPFVRKEALKSLFTFSSVVGTTIGLATLGGADIVTDWTNSDFGKIKIGNTRYEISGGFQQYIRLAGQLSSGKITSSVTGRETVLGEGYKPTTYYHILTRALEMKEAPVISFATQLVKQQGFAGQDLNVPAEVINRVIPMVVQDMYDLYKNGELKDMVWATPAFFGVGVQTYGKQIPTMGMKLKPQGTGFKLIPDLKLVPMPGIGEDIATALGGKESSTLPKETWEPLSIILQAQQQIDWTKQDISKLRREPIDTEVSEAFKKALEK